MSTAELQKMYTRVCFSIVPYYLRQQLIHSEEPQSEEAMQAAEQVVNNMSASEFTDHLPFDEFLDKFRFRPRHPEDYVKYGYRPPEEERLWRLSLVSSEIQKVEE